MTTTFKFKPVQVDSKHTKCYSPDLTSFLSSIVSIKIALDQHCAPYNSDGSTHRVSVWIGRWSVRFCSPGDGSGDYRRVTDLRIGQPSEAALRRGVPSAFDSVRQLSPYEDEWRALQSRDRGRYLPAPRHGVVHEQRAERSFGAARRAHPVHSLRL